MHKTELHCFDATHGWKSIEIAQYIKNFSFVRFLHIFCLQSMRFFFSLSLVSFSCILVLHKKIKNSRRGYRANVDLLAFLHGDDDDDDDAKKKHREPNNLLLTLVFNRLVANFLHNQCFFFYYSLVLFSFLLVAVCMLRLFQSEHEEIVETSACKWNQFFFSLETE